MNTIVPVNHQTIEQTDNDWHEMPPGTALERLGASSDGLSEDEAGQRLKRYGFNRLPEPQSRSALYRFVRHFNNVLIYVLLSSAVITMSLGHLIDTIAILAVVLANAAIGYVHEGKAVVVATGDNGCLSRARGGCRDVTERRTCTVGPKIEGFHFGPV